MTPLHWAAVQGQQHAVRDLVRGGADLSLRVASLSGDDTAPTDATGVPLNAARVPTGKTARELVEWAKGDTGLVWFDRLVVEQGTVCEAYSSRKIEGFRARVVGRARRICTCRTF